jgi:hypothetical protein
MLPHTHTRSLVHVPFLGGGSRVEKVHHKFQNFNGLGLMRFPFSFETDFDKVNETWKKF